MSKITAFRTHDIRFPTSSELSGSDAMNPDPDYSAAYLTIETDAADALTGHGFVFTIGRGNDVEVAALQSLSGHLVGRNVEALLDDMGAAWRLLVHDSQLRWLGPEKGVEHMAIGAVLTALWDLKAKRAGLPLWRLLGSMTPQELVDCVDFRYLTDALTPEEALDILQRAAPGRAARIENLCTRGYPGYSTAPGWLGYDDDKLVHLARQALAQGFTQIKLKIGADLDDDRRRLALARRTVGPDIRIAVDANQRWDVATAIAWIDQLREYDIAWVEEPTSPDDVLGNAAIARAIAPIPLALGEHTMNRVLAKQLLQAHAQSVVQIDATRVAGPSENLAILLLAAKFGVRVCPHAGGVGLCELVSHMAMFDYVAVSGSWENRCIEYVDNLHQHFVNPTVIRAGRYVAPTAPGAGSEMKPESIDRYTYRN